jgi:hypothetical protein
MAEVKLVPDKKKIVRKRAGYRRVMVTLTEERAKVLDELAAADMRQGGATEMFLMEPQPKPFTYPAAGEPRNTGRDYIQEMKVAAKQEAAAIRPPAVTLLDSKE